MSTTEKTAKQKPPSPLTANGFNRIAGSFYLYKPLSTGTTTSTAVKQSHDPEIILLFAWGNAPPKAVVKYTSEYQRRYPRAQILLFLTTFAEIFLYTSKRHSESLDIAVKHLLSEISASGKSRPRILVHLFSNAGSFKFRELARYYRQQASGQSSASATGSIMPMDLFVLDSSPGHPNFYRRMVGTQTQLPRQAVLYWLGSLVVFLVLCVYAIIQFVFQRTPILERVWVSLNDVTKEGQLVDQSAKRIYIYSKIDELVDWQDVVDHGSDAKAKGFKVQMEEFSQSKHVAHVLVDGKRYWNLITDGWEEALG